MAKKKNTGDLELIQQGDVLFYRVDEMPGGLVKKPRQADGLATFALGEATGHHHSAVVSPTTDGGDNIELYEDAGGVMWVRVVEAPVAVNHQEHGTVTLEPGLYRRGLVREYDPLEQECRAVRD